MEWADFENCLIDIYRNDEADKIQGLFLGIFS
jgi:hypothetical protein